MRTHLLNQTILWIKIGLTAVVLLIFSGCKVAPITGGSIQQQKLTDGIYIGESSFGPNSAEVKVTIKNHIVLKIELLAHDAWKGHKADTVIPSRIIEQQSTNVDAVTGATNSSHVIMNAVEQAIQKSYKAGENRI